MKQRLRTYFFNLFIKITFLTTLVVLALSLFLYINFKSSSIRLINQSNEALMQQVIHNAEQIHSYIRNYSVSLVGNLDTANLMYGQNLSVHETLTSMRALDLMLKANPYIESFYVYNGRTDTYYIIAPNPLIRQGGAFDPELDAMLKANKPISRLVPIPRKIPGGGLTPQGTDALTYALPEYDLNGKVKSALIMNVQVDSFLSHMTAGTPESLDMKSLWFLGPKGQVFAHTERALFMSDGTNEPYVRSIMQSGASSGYFSANVGGTPSVVTYVHSEPLDWKLVGVTPYDTIAAIADSVKYVTLIIGLIMLAVCLFAAFMLSRHLYAPVRSLRNKFSPHAPKANEAEHADEFALITDVFTATRYTMLDLQRFRDNHWVALKQKALSDMLRAGLPLSRTESEWTREYGIGLAAGQPVAVAVLKIDRYAAFCARYNEPDRALLRYALTNIATEIVGTDRTCEPVDMGDDQAALIIGFADNEDEERLLERKLRHVQDSFEQYCGWSLSVFVSEPAFTLRELPELYRDALELANERLKRGHRCLLLRGRMPLGPDGLFDLDSQLLTQLLDALKESKPGKIDEACGRLMAALRDCNYNSVMVALAYLSSALFNWLHTLQSNSTLSFQLSFTEFDRKLKQLETLEEIEEEFRAVFRSIAEQTGKGRDDRAAFIVEGAQRYIDEHYADKALSAQLVADLFKLTPAYINKLFRERHARSMADYLTEVRMEQAKRLLGETQLTVEQIVDRIGWENKKYFFTLFKKHVGVTPTEYRLKLSVDRIHS